MNGVRVELIDGQRKPEATWHASVLKMLDAHEKPVAEVTIAVIPAIRKLVDAAGSGGLTRMRCRGRCGSAEYGHSMRETEW